MKRLRKPLCVAVAALWVLPVSATEWDQRGQARLDLTGLAPELESLEPLSSWNAVVADEFAEFDIAEYELRFELANAVWDSSADADLFIDVFDGTGARLTTAGPFDYAVNTSFIPSVVTVQNAMHQAAANAVVQSLPMNLPAARRIQLRPRLIIQQVRDCNQQVTMRTWFRYNHELVGTDEPDHLVVPSVFTC